MSDDRAIGAPQTCAGCRFFIRVPERLPEPKGECRRHTPTALLIEHNWETGVWPVVADTAWCGEFEVR
jgi:hypothetical protein